MSRPGAGVIAVREKAMLASATLATVLAACLLALSGSAQEAGAAFPGENGKIVFESKRDGDSEIYSMNADGTGQTNLTKSPSTSDTQPTVSADGTRVAFVREAREDPSTRETSGISVMNADGTGQTKLRENYSEYYSYSSLGWSPDGEKLVYAVNSLGGSGLSESVISIMNATDGTEHRDLNAAGRDPVFSPDGTKIAFISDGPTRAHASQEEGLLVVNADGTEQTNLTPGGDSQSTTTNRSDPSWSPDGEKIAFGQSSRTYVDDGDPGEPFNYEEESGVYAVNADGTGQTRLSDHGTGPAWSPDGGKIAFRTGGSIYAMNADGTGQARLTNSELDAWPDWGAAPGTATAPTPSPTTAITSGPAEGSTTTERSATFKFSSDKEGSSFRCGLDGGPLTDCSSPKKLTDLTVGKHVFRVGATDADGKTDITPASRTWRVKSNQPPTAGDDAFSTRAGKTLTVRRPGVLRDDQDPDGNSLTAERISRPKHGRLALKSTGSFVYEPDRNYRGSDRFVYKVSDGKGGTDTAEVNIRVKR